MNVLVCREASVIYREDVVLEDAWHEDVKKVGLKPHYDIKTSSMVFEVVAVVIRQCASKNYLWQVFLGADGK